MGVGDRVGEGQLTVVVELLAQVGDSVRGRVIEGVSETRCLCRKAKLAD